jgi:hypothetical protein
MGGNRDGVLGTEAHARSIQAGEALDVFGDGDSPGSLGIGEPIALDTQRLIARVAKDWDPPSPQTTPEIVVRGTTLEQVGNELNAMAEWGQAGGSIRSERIPPGNSTNLAVHLHANLLYRLPRWTGYASASTAVKAEWDKMFAKLKAHEDRHLAIAIEESDALAQDLIGHDISDIAALVTAANKRMHDRQVQLDDDTDHGAKVGVPYGDVVLDTSIT